MPASDKVAIENNVAAVMRDGTVLRADIYHPANGRKYPILLCRPPYQKLSPRYVDHATTLASRGYTAIVQDQRGRYASDGEYRWMFRRVAKPLMSRTASIPALGPRHCPGATDESEPGATPTPPGWRGC